MWGRFGDCSKNVGNELKGWIYGSDIPASAQQHPCLVLHHVAYHQGSGPTPQPNPPRRVQAGFGDVDRSLSETTQNLMSLEGLAKSESLQMALGELPSTLPSVSSQFVMKRPPFLFLYFTLLC